MTPENTIIFIADDDTDYLQQTCSNLEKAGYKTLTAESQLGAERILDEIKPDIAIIDLMMEREDSGLVLCYKLKKKYPDVPVIILNGVSDKTGSSFNINNEDYRKWIRADSCLVKEVNTEVLLEEIRKLLRK